MPSFTYRSDRFLNFGSSNDGIVYLESQPATPAREEAARLFGFNETHDGILNSAPARKTFYDLLNAKLSFGRDHANCFY